jgi:hypothetical protein
MSASTSLVDPKVADAPAQPQKSWSASLFSFAKFLVLGLTILFIVHMTWMCHVYVTAPTSEIIAMRMDAVLCLDDFGYPRISDRYESRMCACAPTETKTYSEFECDLYHSGLLLFHFIDDTAKMFGLARAGNPNPARSYMGK